MERHIEAAAVSPPRWDLQELASQDVGRSQQAHIQLDNFQPVLASAGAGIGPPREADGYSIFRDVRDAPGSPGPAAAWPHASSVIRPLHSVAPSASTAADLAGALPSGSRLTPGYLPRRSVASPAARAHGMPPPSPSRGSGSSRPARLHAPQSPGPPSPPLSALLSSGPSFRDLYPFQRTSGSNATASTAGRGRLQRSSGAGSGRPFQQSQGLASAAQGRLAAADAAEAGLVTCGPEEEDGSGGDGDGDEDGGGGGAGEGGGAGGGAKGEGGGGGGGADGGPGGARATAGGRHNSTGGGRAGRGGAGATGGGGSAAAASAAAGAGPGRKASRFNLWSWGAASSFQMRAFHLAWSGLAMAFAATFAPAALLPTIQDDLRLSKEVVGGAGVAALAASIITRVLAATWLRRVGPRYCQVATLLLIAVSLACMALVRGAAAFVLVRFLLGTTLAQFVVAQFWVVSMFDSAALSTAAATCASWGNGGAGLPMLVMPLLFSALKRAYDNDVTAAWHAAFYFPAVGALGLAVLTLVYGQDTPTGDLLDRRTSREAMPYDVRKAYGGRLSGSSARTLVAGGSGSLRSPQLSHSRRGDITHGAKSPQPQQQQDPPYWGTPGPRAPPTAAAAAVAASTGASGAPGAHVAGVGGGGRGSPGRAAAALRYGTSAGPVAEAVEEAVAGPVAEALAPPPSPPLRSGHRQALGGPDLGGGAEASGGAGGGAMVWLAMSETDGGIGGAAGASAYGSVYESRTSDWGANSETSYGPPHEHQPHHQGSHDGQRGQQHRSQRSYRWREALQLYYLAARNHRTLLLALSYGVNFGVELVAFNMLPLYLSRQFGLGPISAGAIASGFALLNAVTRLSGGMLSAALARRFGMRGRLWLLWGAQSAGGLFCALMGGAARHSLGATVVLMALFGVGSQQAAGACFAITPYVSYRCFPAVMGIVSAGAHLVAVLLNAALFAHSGLSFAQGWLWMGLCILAVSCSLLLLHFPAWGSMLGAAAPAPPGGLTLAAAAAASAATGVYDPRSEEAYYLAEWTLEEQEYGLARGALAFARFTRAERGGAAAAIRVSASRRAAAAARAAARRAGAAPRGGSAAVASA